MNILKNVNIEQLNASIKNAIALKKEISSLKKEVLQLSKDAIEYCEKGDVASAEAALVSSERKINKIKAYIKRSEVSLHFQSDLLYSVEKEYCEAVIVCSVMKNAEIPGYDELNTDPLSYLHSFIEAVSELGKINEKLENKARIASNKVIMIQIFETLESLKHYAGNITGDIDNQLDKLRHKVYTGKTDLTLTPDDAAAVAAAPLEEAPAPLSEPDPQNNREVMADMSKIISQVTPASDNDLRDFKKTWKKVSENLKTGLIDTKDPNKAEPDKGEFEVEGGVLKAYTGKSQNVTIPAGVQVIASDAFSGCKEVVQVKLSATVKEVKPYAFANCKNLSAFYVDPKNASFSQAMGILYNKSKTALICYPSNDKTKHKKSLPATLTEICEGAFAYCKNLETITIPDTVTVIHRFAFTHCYNLKIVAREGSAAYKFARDLNMLKTSGEGPSRSREAAEKPADMPVEGFYFRSAKDSGEAEAKPEEDKAPEAAEPEETAPDAAVAEEPAEAQTPAEGGVTGEAPEDAEAAEPAAEAPAEAFPEDALTETAGEAEAAGEQEEAAEAAEPAADREAPAEGEEKADKPGKDSGQYYT
ncbi:MAG: leucine-rich repeat protein, partial [Abditibacteriota bacterium]|nr:leucine-rich repeat protein [Abditibacteriota bacterium]